MDEYCPSTSESVICSTTPLASEATPGGRTGGGATGTAAGAVGLRPGAGAGCGIQSGANENGVRVVTGTDVNDGTGSVLTSTVTGLGMGGTGNAKSATPINSFQPKSRVPKPDAHLRTKPAELDKESTTSKGKTQTQSLKVNGVLEKQTGSPTRSSLSEKLAASQSPKLKPYKNGKIDLDTCKMNGKMHLEYDAHWRWVQSQEDVTFL